MDSYTQAATERAMKVQEVMLQAMSKKISWWQAAEILGITDRHMRRIREKHTQTDRMEIVRGGAFALQRET
jgi:tRNA G37 N-methylase TrmD